MSEGCAKHVDHENRINKLEEAIVEIRDELRAKAIDDAKIQNTLDLVQRTLLLVQKDTSGLRDDMIKLVAETLEKTRTDMSSLMKISASNDEKDKEWQRRSEESRMEWQHRSEEADKRFYRRLIIGCVSILGTIVLSYFGIKALIPIFS